MKNQWHVTLYTPAFPKDVELDVEPTTTCERLARMAVDLGWPGKGFDHEKFRVRLSHNQGGWCDPEKPISEYPSSICHPEWCTSAVYVRICPRGDE